VVWYTGQFYALFFLTSTLKVPFVQAYTIVGVSLLIGTPFFILFGALSDRIGRKPIIMGGCLLAALSYYPLFRGMAHFAHPLNMGAEIAIVTVQVFFVTAVYGPVAAFLVEFFPAKVRYTLLSIPYHLGNGEFGGWLPTIFTGIVAATVIGQTGYIPFLGLDLRGLNPSGDPNGNIYAGLIYTITVAVITAIVGWFFIPETKDRKIWEEVGGQPAVGEGAATIP
jgi:MFS family permease